MSDNHYLAVALSWRKDAKVHIYEVGAGITLCGKNALDGWALESQDPTCRGCRRAWARINSQHPLLL